MSKNLFPYLTRFFMLKDLMKFKSALSPQLNTFDNSSPAIAHANIMSRPFIKK